MSTVFVFVLRKKEFGLTWTDFKLMILGVWDSKPTLDMVLPIRSTNPFLEKDIVRLLNGEQIKVNFGHYQLVEIESGINFIDKLEQACRGN